MQYGKNKRDWLRLAGLTLALLIAGLVSACGNDTTNPTETSSTTISATNTTNTTTQTATTNAATNNTATTTTAVATTGTTTAVNTTQPPATTAAVSSTTIAATTQVAATTQPAPTAAQLPPVGNKYPAGPAPTAAPPAGGLVDVPLNVPDQFKGGRFSTPHTLKVPAGFVISVYAQLDSELRFVTFSPDGRLFATERGGGRVVVVKDNGATGTPQTWAEGLNGPHGLAFHAAQGKMYLYVAENDKVTRFAYENGQPKAASKEVIVKGLPAGDGHTTRSIAFGPDGKMYIAAGSSCNVCEESDPRRAAVTQYNDDGSGQKVFATGLRNEVGIKFNPATGELWGVENSRDNLGNEIPPEEVNILQEGGFYGWPYCYSNQVYDKNFGGKNPDICKQSIPPALPMQAHSAPLGLDFYYPKTQQFPDDFKGDVFVGFHGSWNRSPATGYKVVRVRVKDGRPVSYEDFITGWQTGPSSSWGRPVDVLTAPDGSLFVTDDSTNAIYHVTYQK